MAKKKSDKVIVEEIRQVIADYNKNFMVKAHRSVDGLQAGQIDQLDDGLTLEVTRCCVRDGVPHACSMLYGAAWRAVKAMGFKRLITYTLVEEAGTSLKAAGWKALYDTGGGSWSRPSRPTVDHHPLGQKTLWEAP